jgi:electron-transferring-flavoprotein dehydrogenase
VLYNEDGSVKGVATGNMGISKEGEPTGDFQLGMELHGKYTIFAEGARGHLGKQIIAKYSLDANRDPQTYGLGIKELWEIDPKRHKPGMVLHTGWPMKSDTYGGAFLYHLEDNLVTLGFITGLDYSNPYLSPFEEMQRWKTHPNIRYYLEGDEANGIKPAKRISYGAAPSRPAASPACPLCLPRRRAGGLRSRLPQRQPHQGQPRRDQDRHAGRRSRLRRHRRRSPGRRADRPTYAFENSWLYEELWKARNFKAWFKKGLTTATVMNGLEQFVLRGNIPWTLHRNKPDHAYLKPAAECAPIEYPKPDGKLTFDRLSSVFISSTNHARTSRLT